jgi:multiple sugar transport system ATP-binding protein
MRSEILNIHRKLKTTSIYVTHDQSEAMALGDRIAVMKDGVALQIGTPSEVYRNPKSLFIANFTGKTNTIKGFLMSEQRKLNFKTSDKNIMFTLDQEQTSLKFLPFTGKFIDLAIRLEDIHLYPSDNACRYIPINVCCLSVEYHGHQSLIHFAVKDFCGTTDYNKGGNILTMRVPSDNKINLGDNLTVYLDLDKVHIFEGVSF